MEIKEVRELLFLATDMHLHTTDWIRSKIKSNYNYKIVIEATGAGICNLLKNLYDTAYHDEDKEMIISISKNMIRFLNEDILNGHV